MKINEQKWLYLAAALSLAGALTGCTDEDLAEGLGSIAIGAGSVAVRETAETAARCEPAEREICHEYRDYSGDWHRECETARETCSSLRWTNNSLLSGGAMGAKLISAQPKLTATSWAAAFNIGFAGSKKLLSALEMAKDRDLSAVLALGFTREDVQRMARRSLPSEGALESLAKNLDQDSATTRAMIQRVLELSGHGR